MAGGNHFTGHTRVRHFTVYQYLASGYLQRCSPSFRRLGLLQAGDDTSAATHLGNYLQGGLAIRVLHVEGGTGTVQLPHNVEMVNPRS